MSSVLIEAVLSCAPDYGLLLESLSWSEDSWPGTEQLGALAALIEGLGTAMALSENSEKSNISTENRKTVTEKVSSIIWSQCLPLLHRISLEPGGGGKHRETTAAVCRLVSACVPVSDDSVPGLLVLAVLPSLQLPEEETGVSGLGVELACEVMAAVIPYLPADEQLTLTTLTSALSRIKSLPEPLVSRVTGRLLLPLLESCSDHCRLDHCLTLILDELCDWHSAVPTPVTSQRALLCLTALSDHLLGSHRFAASPCSGPRSRRQFWRIVQDGLTHADCVSRKRALYLLKRCVALSEEERMPCPPRASDEGEILFRWSPDKSKLIRQFWEDYVLVLETLEENQVHVVRPVLNRIDLLIQTAVNDTQDSTHGLFHPSWLLCVYQRMFHSENKSLMREGVCHLLELQVLQQPQFALAFSQFVIGPFMDVLSETSLFYRSADQSPGDCPELAYKLQIFMRTFFSSLPPDCRGHALLQMIKQLGSKHWCAVPLLFLSQALSELPPSPLLGTEGLTALREVLRCTMITHQVLLRGAAQCFLLNSALRLTDVSSVTLDDVFSFLVDFRADESLCRSTLLWKQLCSWLSENDGRFKPRTPSCSGGDAPAKKETVQSYVEEEILNFLSVQPSTGQPERIPNPKEAERLARAVLLCVDVERARPGVKTSDVLDPLLSPLLETLSRICTNIYLPVRKSDKSLQLVLRLFQLGKRSDCQLAAGEEQDDVMVALQRLFLKVVDSIQEFILRRLLGELQELFDIERAELYLSVLQQLAVVYASAAQHRRSILQTCLPKLINHSLKLLQEPSQQIVSVGNQVAGAVAMASLAMVCGLMEQKVISTQQSEVLTALKSVNDFFCTPVSSSAQRPASLGTLNKHLERPPMEGGVSDAVLQKWGRVAANFTRNQWVCLSFLMKEFGSCESVNTSADTLKAALSCSMEALTLLPGDLVLPVLAFVETLLPRVVQHDETLCAQALTLSWGLVLGLATNPHDFWLVLKRFVSAAFQHRLLQLSDSQAPTLVSTLKQISAQLMELSQTKSGVFGVLLEHCCHTWMPMDGGSSDVAEDVFCSVFSHINILAEACVHGPVFRRDQRLIQDVQTYVEQLGDGCAANIAVEGDGRDDQMPRACAMAFLSRLDPTNLQHQRLMEELVTLLLIKDDDISKSKVRYYSNSLQHRVKNRVWQTLLLLLPKLREEFVATLLKRVFEAGFCSNQASVKYLLEWLMILILFYYPQHVDKFWACFSMDHEKTKTSICTFLSVLVHFNIILPKLRDEAAQLRKALDVTLQWCFNHNFSVRLYALLALKRVWSLAEGQASEGADGLAGLSTVVRACLNQAEAMQSTGNANKNWIRIQEHFFFGAFHPIRDLSAETIFYTFPSLSEVADDEWLPPCKFHKLTCFCESLSLPLRNPRPDLRQLQPGDWIQQDRGEQNKEDCWADVQKKITPWRLGVQEQEPELHLVPQQRAARLGKRHGALLVVASLIDKPTNLGGLCRTCEIFGASALVLDNLRHVSDKQFQSLSVSSELWLPLLEVKPVELTNFLQLKKSEGYCIVGVEQTANSHSLQDYQFPEKTLLLLGNEREGIPANLLQMLDVCVEIPQQGVIRSLNVHVSAALLIWEYTRQRLSGRGPTEVEANSP